MVLYYCEFCNKNEDVFGKYAVCRTCGMRLLQPPQTQEKMDEISTQFVKYCQNCHKNQIIFSTSQFLRIILENFSKEMTLKHSFIKKAQQMDPKIRINPSNNSVCFQIGIVLLFTTLSFTGIFGGLGIFLLIACYYTSKDKTPFNEAKNLYKNHLLALEQHGYQFLCSSCFSGVNMK